MHIPGGLHIGLAFQYNSHISWCIFTLCIPIETGKILYNVVIEQTNDAIIASHCNVHFTELLRV